MASPFVRLARPSAQICGRRPCSSCLSLGQALTSAGLEKNETNDVLKAAHRYAYRGSTATRGERRGRGGRR
jgi:hypothetical protein